MPDASSVDYIVPGMTLIQQDQSKSCWFASALMVLTWKSTRSGNPVTPNVDQETLAQYLANDGLAQDQVLAFARRVGLTDVPPQSPTVGAILGWLQDHGPLWTVGTAHVVVIAGIRSAAGGHEVLVYDPWPANGVGWRSLSGWYAGLDPEAADEGSRDTSGDVQAEFLFAP
ncbi:MAG: papain-like cysteine protease family protein [Roseiarcus sp.]